MKNKSDYIAHCAYRAAVMEASTEKPGNVTPSKSFENLKYSDFVAGAKRLEPYVLRAANEGENSQIGKLIYEATSKEKNINFGIVMLFIPLAASHGKQTKKILENLNTIDTKWIVQAIQKGRVGGLELKDKKLHKYDVLSHDIFKTIDDENISPLDLMKMSEPHDTLAKEWMQDYPLTREIAGKIEEDQHSIVNTYLWVLSKHPDTLIARKAGMGVAKKISEKAGDVLNGILNISEFDYYLRSQGNTFNPGTTADLIASGLFLKLICKD